MPKRQTTTTSNEGGQKRRRENNWQQVERGTTTDVATSESGSAIANCSSPQRTLPEELNPSRHGCVERMEEPDEFITTIFICLNTIITPLLKEYIPQVVQDFYNSLVDMHRINTQCYPDVLKEYRGHQYRYGYINGNHRINSRMQAFAPNLDYRVAGAVDLTKLIIWTNRYNQFSECDLSELCNIITNINSFPSEVVRRIGKVRKVRNSVAHNNTDEWDRPKFITSLNEMTDLIMALDIDSDEQRLCVDKIEKIKEGSNCLRLVDGIPVKFTFTIKTRGSAHEATIHGFSDQQENQTLEKLETEANFNYDNSPFTIKAKKKQSIKLDLRADMSIYKSTDSFKLAVYELLQRVITASGVTENDNVGLDIEFLLPKNITKEQLIVVAESFPGALDRKLEKAILNFKKINQSGKKWKKVREKTVPELEIIERKLNEAAIDLENFRRRRNLVAGASFVGGLLAAPFTGGASLAALGLAFGTVTFVVSLVFEKHLTGEVMKNVQVAIDIDKETTKMLREQAQHYANVDDDLSKRLLKHFPGFILAVLAGSFSEFLKGFIDSTADSVRRTKYEVMDLRRNLEEELRTVEEMLQESMLEVPVEAKRHH